MPRTLINRNMPGDGSSKLAIGLLDCWSDQTTLLKNSFFRQRHFPWVFSGAEIFRGILELIIVPLAGVT